MRTGQVSLVVVADEEHDGAGAHPDQIDLWSYMYSTAQRPGVRVREAINGDNIGGSYWRFGDPYLMQSGNGRDGDLPGDIKFFYSAAVVRDDDTGDGVYAIYGASWVLLPPDDPEGARFMPPFQGAAGGPDGGPLLTVHGHEIDALFVPLGVRPGAVLEAGDLFRMAGPVMPTLPSLVAYTVTAPDGSERVLGGRANAVGYFYDSADDFVLDQPGLWTVTLQVTHDGQTSAGPVEPPFPTGGPLTPDVASFTFVVADAATRPLRITTDLAELGPDEWWSGRRNATFETDLPSTWDGESVRLVVTMPGVVLLDEDMPITGRRVRWELDAEALNRLASNFDYEGGLGDTVTVTFYAEGRVLGQPAQAAGSIVTHGARLPVAPSQRKSRRSVFLTRPEPLKRIGQRLGLGPGFQLCGGRDVTQQRHQQKGFLFDVRVLELADQRGEYCGKLLAGAGADVVKVEPPQGSETRGTGPFYHDEADPERSLHFWHYNLGKRGVTLDVARPEGQALLKDLVPHFDILVETFPPGYLESLGLGYDTLRELNPRLIMTSITPFGQSGPRRDWKGSDLVHLALGGIMNCCGYDPLPSGEYDTPPIAPQMWHASHIVGNHAYMAIVAALLFREQTGKGQYIDAPIHQAVSANTEMDIPLYVYNRKHVLRQTARHAQPEIRIPHACITKDGRYAHCSDILGGDASRLAETLDADGMADDLLDPKYRDAEYGKTETARRHVHDVIKRWVMAHKFDADLWHKGQAIRLHWAPIRRPEENLEDPHWDDRGSFAQVRHDDIDRTLTYPGHPWRSEAVPWKSGPRAPHLGEHNADVFGEELKLPKSKLDDLRKKGVV